MKLPPLFIRRRPPRFSLPARITLTAAATALLVGSLLLVWGGP